MLAFRVVLLLPLILRDVFGNPGDDPVEYCDTEIGVYLGGICFFIQGSDDMFDKPRAYFETLCKMPPTSVLIGGIRTQGDLAAIKDALNKIPDNYPYGDEDCFGLDKPNGAAEKRCAICEVWHKDSPPSTIATTPTTTTTTTKKPTPAPFYVTRGNSMELWNYYHFAKKLHALANPGGWFMNYLAGQGWSMTSGNGPDGWVIQSHYLAQARAGCGERGSSLHILRIRWENGNAWIARVGWADGNDVGIVSQAEGVCGANRPIWTWSCAVSPDWMYTNGEANMESNTWYRGRRWSATPEFYTWNL